MKVLRNHSLKSFNTFGLDVVAKQFVAVHTEEELTEVLKQVYASELFILGGGSNILFTSAVLDSTVLHIALKGKEIISETDTDVFIKVNAGENWHEFVRWCIDQDFGGIENLSLIPGNVGTSPIQNIGAYGVELKDVFIECSAIHIQTLGKKTFSFEDCKFGYRNSIFKNELKGQYIITEVVFKLTKKNHELHTSYGAIKAELDKMDIDTPSIKAVSNAVISIRQQKLPNPAELGNSGSFFKNPVISVEEFEKLQEKFPEIPSYKVSSEEVKIPAGWLIDTCGLKGYRDGDAGVHKNQALVLVNYNNATGKEILALAEKVKSTVLDTFGIQLESEVNIIA